MLRRLMVIRALHFCFKCFVGRPILGLRIHFLFVPHAIQEEEALQATNFPLYFSLSVECTIFFLGSIDKIMVERRAFSTIWFFSTEIAMPYTTRRGLSLLPLLPHHQQQMMRLRASKFRIPVIILLLASITAPLLFLSRRPSYFSPLPGKYLSCFYTDLLL